MMPTQLQFEAAGHRVSALLERPPDATAALVLGHGAGAGMRHVFMEKLSERLAAVGIATFRYAFPYSEAGKARIDPQPVLLATIRAAVVAARDLVGELPLVAGGKSMGGRMTTLAAAESSLPHVRGIVLVGFPLHAAGKPPGVERAEHLERVAVPTLFLQGTRDSLADLELMRGVCAHLGAAATLHVVDGADHSFHVPKKSGRTDDDVLAELAERIASWTRELVGTAVEP